MDMALSVLIVDDSDPIRERVAETLGSISGIGRIDQASSVGASHRYIAARWADVFVLDIALPDGSGIDVLRAVRRSGRPAVVIILTNHPSPPYRDRCVREGADFFLDKSTQFDDLTPIVANLARVAGEVQ